MIAVRSTPRAGRGVFATRDIDEGETIEVAPVVVIPREETPLIQCTRLEGYVFKWGGGSYALALGSGSLYNHSYSANATYYQDTPNRCLEFVAVRAIRAGEQITINYNGSPDAAGDVGFSVEET